MKCDVCGERDATVHLTEVINDSISKLHLCEECAQAKGQEIQSHFGLNDLLSGLMDFGPGMQDEQKDALVKVKCPTCGTTFFDIQKTGKMGCGDCYKKFSDSISELLRKIHGADRHVGKMPLGAYENIDREQDFVALRKKMQELISQEAFEQAAVIRDRLKELEQKFEAGKNGS